MKFNVCNLPKCCRGCTRLSLINLDHHFWGEFECKSHDASLLYAFFTGECPYRTEISTEIKVEVKKMDPVELLKEAYRFCSQYTLCNLDCPLHGKCIFNFDSHAETQKETEQKIENAVAIIEQWSKDHPVVTNEMKFCEIFGDNAANSILSLYPSDIKNWLAQPYRESKNGNSN